FTRAILISGLSTRSCQRPSAAAGLDRREAARQAPASLATTTASLPLSPDVGPWPGWKRPGFFAPARRRGPRPPPPLQELPVDTGPVAMGMAPARSSGRPGRAG